MLWWNGPKWLSSFKGLEDRKEIAEEPVSEACLVEMRAKDRKIVTTAPAMNSEPAMLCNIIQSEAFSNLGRLPRVTALLLKFIKLLKAQRQEDVKQKPEMHVTGADEEEAELLWMKEVQREMNSKETFKMRSHQLGLFEDDKGVVRCQGRLGKSEVTDSVKYLILRDASHHLTAVVVWRCHESVMHGGVKEILTELRSNFWIVRGRYFIRSLLFIYTVCKKFEGKPYKVPPFPSLPSYRVEEAPAFSYIGLDYVEPHFVKATSEEERKVWICLFTCCSTRAAHFEVVPSMTSEAFLRCFRRFVARRSRPLLVVSNNAKTFKSASKELGKIINDPSVVKYSAQEKIKWSYNLKKAPWWGGFYE